MIVDCRRPGCVERAAGRGKGGGVRGGGGYICLFSPAILSPNSQLYSNDIS